MWHLLINLWNVVEITGANGLRHYHSGKCAVKMRKVYHTLFYPVIAEKTQGEYTHPLWKCSDRGTVWLLLNVSTHLALLIRHARLVAGPREERTFCFWSFVVKCFYLSSVNTVFLILCICHLSSATCINMLISTTLGLFVWFWRSWGLTRCCAEQSIKLRLWLLSHSHLELASRIYWCQQLCESGEILISFVLNFNEETVLYQGKLDNCKLLNMVILASHSMHHCAKAL